MEDNIFKDILTMLLTIILTMLLIAGTSWFVQVLWNITIAILFNVPLITFPQAIGLYILTGLLFRGQTPSLLGKKKER